jgi:hypothetical protein
MDISKCSDDAKLIAASNLAVAEAILLGHNLPGGQTSAVPAEIQAFRMLQNMLSKLESLAEATGSKP